MLLMAYTCGLRRSEIVSLDDYNDSTQEFGSCVAIIDDKNKGGALLNLDAKTGFGPVFAHTTRDDKQALDGLLRDKHVAQRINQTVPDAVIRSVSPEKNGHVLFSGHSSWASLA